MKYEEWNYGVYSEFPREMELKQRGCGKNQEIFFCLGGDDLWQLWKNVLYKLEIDIDPRYVQFPKGLVDSLEHQCCLMTCVLG